MLPAHVRLLACPHCGGDLALAPTAAEAGERIEQGQLDCYACGATYPVRGGVPRFVPDEGYAGSFGFQWHRHAHTQLDSYTGQPISERRFFEETRWPRDLTGELVLEVGAGAGRFTEQAASTGATLVSIEYSRAVDANYAANGARDNVLLVQGDLHRLPVPEGRFDRVFCFGVLQHTPDPRRSFQLLPRHLRPGGSLAVDVYRAPKDLLNRLFATKYWARHVTKRLPPEALYALTRRYVEAMWPVSGVIHRLWGNWINWLLLIQDYRGIYELPDELLREWAVLDSFDALSPAYDQPQQLETVRRWFEQAGLAEVDVHYGYNGIEGRGRRPEETALTLEPPAAPRAVRAG